MKVIKIIILIVICLYVGAYVGKENMNKGAEISVQKTKACCIWIKDTWDNTESEKE